MLNEIEFEVNEDFWKNVEDYVFVFDFFSKTMIEFQTSTLKLSEFWGKWKTLLCVAKRIQAIATGFKKDLAALLIESMETREKQLLTPGNKVCLSRFFKLYSITSLKFEKNVKLVAS